MGRSIIAVTAAAALLGGGCVSRQHPRAAYAADGMYAPPPGQRDEAGPADCPGFGIAFLGASVGTVSFAAGAVTGTVVTIDDRLHGSPPEPPPPPAPAPPPLALDPLPSLATDPETLQLAKQARMAAAAGSCAAGRVDLDRIAARDRAYHDALVTSPALAACR